MGSWTAAPIVEELRQVEDPAAFIENFSGGIAYLNEYLVQEVLSALPSEVRRALLESSILKCFCAPLLAKIFESHPTSAPATLSGRDFVDLLQREGYFAVTLDMGGAWFRYHHVFREFLNRQLEQAMELGGITALHESACSWFESEGSIDGAIHHALAAGDLDRAADIVSHHRLAAMASRRMLLGKQKA